MSEPRTSPPPPTQLVPTFHIEDFDSQSPEENHLHYEPFFEDNQLVFFNEFDYDEDDNDDDQLISISHGGKSRTTSLPDLHRHCSGQRESAAGNFRKDVRQYFGIGSIENIAFQLDSI